MPPRLYMQYTNIVWLGGPYLIYTTQGDIFTEAEVLHRDHID